MGQRSKYGFETKLSAVTKYLERKASAESIGRSIGTNGTRRYRDEKLSSLLSEVQERNNHQCSGYENHTCSLICYFT